MPKTLFVVDDSATMRKVFELTFAGEDVTVVTHDGSDGAVSRARELRPHAIVVDVNLGGNTGYDLVRALRGDGHGGVPIYLLYSDQSPLDDAAARSCGASGAMAKPFDSQAMIDRMRQALATPTSAAAPVAAAPVAAAPVAAPPVAARPPLSAPLAPSPSPGRPPAAPVAPVAAARPMAPASAPLPPPSAPSPTPPFGRTPLGTPAAPMPARPMPAAAPAPARPASLAEADRPPALSLDDDLLGGLPPPAAPASHPMRSPSGSAFPAVPKVAPALSPVEPPAARATAPAVVAASAPLVEAPSAAPITAPSPTVVAAAPDAAVGVAVRAAAEGVAERVAGLGLSAAQVEAITALTREVVERVVWEVVPVLAETIIREEIDRLTRA